MELYKTQKERQLTALVTAKTARVTTGTRPNHPRDHRTPKPTTVPRDLLALLPKQGNKTLYMRYLSKKGCTSPSPGQCFEPNRAHFSPHALPMDAKSFIDKEFSVWHQCLGVVMPVAVTTFDTTFIPARYPDVGDQSSGIQYPIASIGTERTSSRH